MQSKVSGHWTDEDLIAHLYGVGPEGNHVEECAECSGRLTGFEARRNALDQGQQEVPYELLTAQRRKFYQRLGEPARWWTAWRLRSWTSAAATGLVLWGGLAVYQRQQPTTNESRVSDAELAQEVSNMSQDSEPQSTAPLEALFE